MASRTSEQFLQHVLDRIAREGLRRARRACPSLTLRESMRVVHVDRENVRLHVPQYWAVYYHDGRGPVFPLTAKLIIYFRNPREDPRLDNGFPIRATDIKRLTPQQWRDGLRRNAAARAAGVPEPMIVAPFTGPAIGHPFFEEGLANFIQIARNIVLEEFTPWIRSQLPPTGRRETAIFGLG